MAETPLRLPTGAITVLLGPADVRRRVMDLLDDDTGRCSSGHGAHVRRLDQRAGRDAGERLAAAHGTDASIVLVDHLTDGLGAAGRRAILSALRVVATGGAAVLIDDADPVAVLAVADHALRCGSTKVTGSTEVTIEPLEPLGYRAS